MTRRRSEHEGQRHEDAAARRNFWAVVPCLRANRTLLRALRYLRGLLYDGPPSVRLPRWWTTDVGSVAHPPAVLARARAPVDVLVIGEEPLVEETDLAERRAREQEPAPRHPLDVAGRVVLSVVARAPALERDQALVEVDSRRRSSRAGTGRRDAAPCRRPRPPPSPRPPRPPPAGNRDRRPYRCSAHMRSRIPPRSRRAARRYCLRHIPDSSGARYSDVFGKRLRTAGPTETRRAVVDHQRVERRVVDRGQTGKTGERVIRPVPIQHDDQGPWPRTDVRHAPRRYPRTVGAFARGRIRPPCDRRFRDGEVRRIRCKTRVVTSSREDRGTRWPVQA